MKLVTVQQAAQIIGISAQLLHYRVRRGDVPVARYRPTRLRATRVLAYAANMPPVRKLGPRPTDLIDTLATKFATITTR